MKFEGTFQYRGNHGIVFNVSRVTLDSNGMPDLPRAVLHQKADEIDKQIRELMALRDTLRHVAEYPRLRIWNAPPSNCSWRPRERRCP